MKRQFRKVPVMCSTRVDVDPDDLDRVYNIEDICSWDYPADQLVDVLEDNGFAVANPCNLSTACQMYLDECGTFRQVLDQIDTDSGNCVGIYPLAALSWMDQQDVFEYWYGMNH